MPPLALFFRFGLFIIIPFRIFLIPVLYSDEATEDLNAFIAGHRVAHIDRKWIDQGTQSAWAFCVEFVLTSPAPGSESP